MTTESKLICDRCGKVTSDAPGAAMIIEDYPESFRFKDCMRTVICSKCLIDNLEQIACILKKSDKERTVK